MITIIKTSKENLAETEVSLEYAKEQLSGWWIEEHIEPLLMEGTILFTPYFLFQLKEN